MKRLIARSKLVCKTLRLTHVFSALWVRLTITKARTYADGEMPTRLASASSVSLASLGSLKLNSGSPLLGYLKAEQIQNHGLSCGRGVEWFFWRFIVANEQIPHGPTLARDHFLAGDG